MHRGATSQQISKAVIRLSKFNTSVIKAGDTMSVPHTCSFHGMSEQHTRPVEVLGHTVKEDGIILYTGLKCDGKIVQWSTRGQRC